MPIFAFKPKNKAGFECGKTGAKMVVLEAHNGVLRVEHVFIEESSFETRVNSGAKSPIDLARLMLLHKRLASFKITFTAPDAVDVCFVVLPKMSKAETQGAIFLQANKLVSWEGENPILGFTGSEFARDRVGHLVGLADWNATKAWGRIFEMSEGVVNDVTVAACAYESLARAQKWNDEFPVILIADVGASQTCVYVLDSRSLRFMRKIPVGGDAATNMLTTSISTDAGTLKLSDIDAEEVKVTGCLPEPEQKRSKISSSFDSAEAEANALCLNAGQFKQIEMLVRPMVERVSSELIRSIQFVKDNIGLSVDAVFLTGGAVKTPSLKVHVEKSLNLPVRVIDPFAGLSFKELGTKSYAQKHADRLAVAVGLALLDFPSLSLLPKHVHMVKRVAAFIPKTVAILLLIGFLPLMGLGIYRSVGIKMLRLEQARRMPQLQEATQEASLFNEFQQEYVRMSDDFNELQNIMGRSPLWPGVLNALADAVPPDVVLSHCGVGLDKENPDLFLIGGRVLSTAVRFDDAMSSLMSALGSSVFFKRVSIINAQARSSETALGTFEIQCELVY